MSALNTLLQAASSALAGGNTSAAATAITEATTIFGQSSAMTTQAGGFINNFNLAYGLNNPTNMSKALDGLNAMSGQFPASAVTYLTQANEMAQLGKWDQCATLLSNFAVALQPHNVF